MALARRRLKPSWWRSSKLCRLGFRFGEELNAQDEFVVLGLGVRLKRGLGSRTIWGLGSRGLLRSAV